MLLQVSTNHFVNPEAKVVIDYNKYAGIGRPRNADYTLSASHLLKKLPKKPRKPLTGGGRGVALGTDYGAIIATALLSLWFVLSIFGLVVYQINN